MAAPVPRHSLPPPVPLTRQVALPRVDPVERIKDLHRRELEHEFRRQQLRKERNWRTWPLTHTTSEFCVRSDTRLGSRSRSRRTGRTAHRVLQHVQAAAQAVLSLVDRAAAGH
jgi:hypothetical protein